MPCMGAKNDKMHGGLQLAARKDPSERLVEYRQDLADCLTQQGRLSDAAAELHTLLTAQLDSQTELTTLCQLADLQVGAALEGSVGLECILY